jgi:hypothetical protein
VHGPALSRKPGQAEPVWAGPSQAMSDGPARALARLRAVESQSRRLRPRLLTFNFYYQYLNLYHYYHYYYFQAHFFFGCEILNSAMAS